MITDDFVIVFSVLHYLGDWLFQPRQCAVNKSKNVRMLAYHVLTYGLFLMFLFFVWHGSALAFVKWHAVNLALHAIQDWYLYRIGPKIMKWKDNNQYVNNWLFALIGLDQMLHYIVAFWSYAKIHG